MNRNLLASAMLAVLLAGCSSASNTAGYTDLGELNSVTIYAQSRAVGDDDQIAVIAMRGNEELCNGSVSVSTGAQICGATIDDQTLLAFIAPTHATAGALIDVDQGGETGPAALLSLDGQKIAVIVDTVPFDGTLDIQYSLQDGTVVDRYGDQVEK